MKKNHKERMHQLASELQRSHTIEADMTRELVNLLFESAKHNLVNYEGENLLRLQGEARALDRLYKQLTQPAPALTTEQ